MEINIKWMLGSRDTIWLTLQMTYSSGRQITICHVVSTASQQFHWSNRMHPLVGVGHFVHGMCLATQSGRTKNLSDLLSLPSLA
jgi:hypothetical protein